MRTIQFSLLLLGHIVLTQSRKALSTTQYFETSRRESTFQEDVSSTITQILSTATATPSEDFKNGKLTEEENTELQKRCGKYGESIPPKSLNSERSYRKGAPWTVFTIQHSTKSNPNVEMCAGTLISPRHLITAKHWVKSGRPYSVIFCDNTCLADMICRFDKSKCPAKKATILEAKKAFIPSTKFSPYRSDIAIVELEEPFGETFQAYPACLSGTSPSLKDVLHLYAYGSDRRPGNSTLKTMMQHISVTCVPCLKPRPGVVCMQSNNQITNYGDSGGGFMYKINKTNYVTAVVSGYINVTANYGDYQQTVVAPHLSWICN